MNLFKPTLLLTIIFFVLQCVSAADSDLDPTFAAGSGLPSQPLALARQPDGKFIVGGNFESVAGTARKKIGRLNPDGSFDASFTNGSGVDGNGIVWGAAVQSDGKVIIGGEFFSVNGVARMFIARLNTDGSLDASFAPQISERVLRVAVQPDGKILILGDFQSVNGSFLSRKLARLNPDGTLDTSFVNSLGTDIGNTTMKLQPDGKVLVIGPQRLVRLNSDGTQDTTFNPGGSGMSFTNIVGVEVDGSNNIYVGGSITAYNGVPRNNLIRVFPNGSLDASYDPAAPASTTIAAVSAFNVSSEGKVVYAASLNLTSGGSRQGIARLNSNGSLDTSFDSTTAFSVVVSKVLIDPAQRVVVGGQFTTVGTTARARLARLNANGTLDGTFARKRGPNDSVFCLAPLPDGKILIGGGFTTVEETPAGAIARLMPDGALDSSFNTGAGFDGIIGRISVQPDGKIVAAGSFSSFNGVARRNIVRLSADGSLDTSFDPGMAVDGVITDAAIQSDGKIVIVGLFANIAGIPGRHIARLNADGTIDQSFNPGSGADFEIYDVELQPNGQILIGGNFDFFNGSPRSSIARLNSTGTLDSSFNTGTSFDSAILSLALQPDGRIVVGGAFNSVNGQQRNHVARLDSNGTEDPTFLLTGGSSNFEVLKVALQADGKVIVGGTFLSIGNFGRPKLARLNTNGTVDPTFTLGGITAEPGNDSEVDDIAVLPNGKILFAGEFATLNVVEANRVARLIGTFVPRDSSPFDFDGDGKTDVSIFRPSVAEWWINRSSNGSTFAAQFGATGDRIVPGDYTGDAKADIAIWRPSTGEWFVLRSEDFSYYSFPFGTGGDIPSPADYDADGKADVAVFRPSNATWYIRRSTDGGFTIQTFGAIGDVPVPADYDGDNRADIAIFRPSNGQWWLSRSTAGVIAMTFGNSNDKPVQGDYTGDGKTDVAFWRPSTGEWFVLRSENFSYYSFPFGASADIPAPGDYDGDGKFDATVFRSSNATWYSNRSTSGTLIQQFGAGGDRPVANAFVP